MFHIIYIRDTFIVSTSHNSLAPPHLRDHLCIRPRRAGATASIGGRCGAVRGFWDWTVKVFEHWDLTLDNGNLTSESIKKGNIMFLFWFSFIPTSFKLITLQQSNMAIENTLFLGDFPIESLISSGFAVATFDSRNVDPKSPIHHL